MWQEKTGREEEGLFLAGVFDLLDRPGSQLVVPLVLIFVGEHPPVHRGMIAHGRRADQLGRGFGPDAADFAQYLKFGCVRFRCGPALAGFASGAVVKDFTAGESFVAVRAEVLRERDAVFPFG